MAWDEKKDRGDAIRGTMEGLPDLISASINTRNFHCFQYSREKSEISVWKAREPGSAVGIQIGTTYVEVFLNEIYK